MMLGDPNPFGGEPHFRAYVRVCEECGKKWVRGDAETVEKLRKELRNV